MDDFITVNEIHITGNNSVVSQITQHLQDTFGSVEAIVDEPEHYAISLNSFQCELAFCQASEIVASLKSEVLESCNGSEWLKRFMNHAVHSVDIYVKRGCLDLSGMTSNWVALSHVLRGWLDGVDTDYKQSMKQDVIILLSQVYDFKDSSDDVHTVVEEAYESFVATVDGILLPIKAMPYSALILLMVNKIDTCTDNRQKYDAVKKVLLSFLEVCNTENSIEMYAEGFVESWGGNMASPVDLVPIQPSDTPSTYLPLVGSGCLAKITGAEFIDFMRHYIKTAEHGHLVFESVLAIAMMTHMQQCEFARFWQGFQKVASKIDHPDAMIVENFNFVSSRPIGYNDSQSPCSLP